jgi:hypothetical protein
MAAPSSGKHRLRFSGLNPIILLPLFERVEIDGVVGDAKSGYRPAGGKLAAPLFSRRMPPSTLPPAIAPFQTTFIDSAISACAK